MVTKEGKLNKRLEFKKLDLCFFCRVKICAETLREREHFNHKLVNQSKGGAWVT